MQVHYEVTPTYMGLGDSRSLFSSFSSFPRRCPSPLPTLTPPPFSRVFNIKVRCLTGVSLKQGLFCWVPPPTGQERQELVNPCSVRKEDEERGKGSGQNWLSYNAQKRLFRCLAAGMKPNNLISAY